MSHHCWVSGAALGPGPAGRGARRPRWVPRARWGSAPRRAPCRGRSPAPRPRGTYVRSYPAHCPKQLHQPKFSLVKENKINYLFNIIMSIQRLSEKDRSLSNKTGHCRLSSKCVAISTYHKNEDLWKRLIDDEWFRSSSKSYVDYLTCNAVICCLALVICMVYCRVRVECPLVIATEFCCISCCSTLIYGIND